MEWKRICWERDDGKCVMCGEPGAQVDHIEPVGKLAWGSPLVIDPDNGRVLCLPCHEGTESFPVGLRIEFAARPR